MGIATRKYKKNMLHAQSTRAHTKIKQYLPANTFNNRDQKPRAKREKCARPNQNESPRKEVLFLYPRATFQT